MSAAQQNGEVAGFTTLLASSARRANSRWPKLFMTLLAITGLFALYVFVTLALLVFVQGALLRGMPLRLEQVLEIVIAAIALYAALRWNGAVAFAFARSTMDDFTGSPIAADAKESWDKGIVFFFNSFRAGLLIIFGQTLAVCPCFLLQSNFVFSPYLYVYEGLKNTQARKRARELTAGFGWVIFERSAVFLLIGYAVIGLLFVSIFLPHTLLFVIAACIIALYASSIQSQFLREVYVESKQHHAAAHDGKPRRDWIISAVVVALIAIIIYYALKFGLHLASTHFH